MSYYALKSSLPLGMPLTLLSRAGNISPLASPLLGQHQSEQQSSIALPSRTTPRLTKAVVTSSLALLLTGCFDEGDFSTSGATNDSDSTDGITDPDTTGETDSGMGSGTDMGEDPMGMPFPLQPIDSSTLAPSGVYFAWTMPIDEIPTDKTVAGFEFCYTTQGEAFIDDLGECPNALNLTEPNHTLDVVRNTQYHWKTRAIYDPTGNSDDMEVQDFSIDDSDQIRLHLDEGAGDMAADSSPNNNDASLIGFDIANGWVNGLINTGLRFDGALTYLGLDDAFNVDRNQPFSTMKWVRRSSSGEFHALFSRMDYTDAATRRGYWIGFNDSDQLVVMLRNNSTTGNSLEVATSQSFLADPDFYHIAVTYDGSSLANGIHIYVDGVEQQKVVIDNNLTDTIANSAPTRIGSSIPTGGMLQDVGSVLNGDLDEFLLLERDVPLAEVVNKRCFGLKRGGLTLTADCTE